MARSLELLFNSIPSSADCIKLYTYTGVVTWSKFTCKGCWLEL